jgi:hypothetical protein
MPNLSASFEHVTYLSRANTQLRQIDSGFLNPFPMLRSLNLNTNELTRLPLRATRIEQIEQASMCVSGHAHHEYTTATYRPLGR